MRDKKVFLGLCALAMFAVTLSMTTWAAAQQWNEKLLHNFNGTDGFFSQSGLVFDAAGNLYGTTESGGAYNLGTAFELSPMPGGGWTEAVLHDFNNDGSDGWGPTSALVFDAAGNLYGTTGAGGTYHGGTVFELSPVSGGGWTETVLYSFGSGMDGAGPGYGSLVFDAAGNLYGTTSTGGAYGCPHDGCGTVFKLTPGAGITWTETVLYNFRRGSDGHVPYAGVILDAAGNLYGTTAYGGTGDCVSGNGHGCGTVFELTPSMGGEWTETVLHSFGHGTDGTLPFASLIFDPAGNLYGTTEGGGASSDGTVFELSSTVGGGWSETVLYNFGGNSSDGAAPAGGPLALSTAGNLYGTTADGGTYFRGTAFELTLGAGGGWTETVLYNFGNGRDGTIPWSGLIFDRSGKLYGTTETGGLSSCSQFGCGTVFELSPVHACVRCSHAGHH